MKSAILGCSAGQCPKLACLRYCAPLGHISWFAPIARLSTLGACPNLETPIQPLLQIARRNPKFSDPKLCCRWRPSPRASKALCSGREPAPKNSSRLDCVSHLSFEQLWIYKWLRSCLRRYPEKNRLPCQERWKQRLPTTSAMSSGSHPFKNQAKTVVFRPLEERLKFKTFLPKQERGGTQTMT